MDVKGHLAELEEHWKHKNDAQVGELLALLLDGVTELPAEERAAAFDELLEGVRSEHHGLAARVALVAGAVVESGQDAAPLARAIIAPLTRSLEAAARFLERAEEMPDSDEEDALFIGERRISHDSIDVLYEQDAEAVAAYFSLEVWYRPAVAAWTRVTSALAEAQSNPALRTALASVSHASAGGHWLTVVLETSVNDPFVLLLPEIEEAYSVTLDGVVDCGQLCVLLSHALAEPLSRIGVSEPASEQALAVMNGAGPQEDPEASFGSKLHLYPWQAMDPETSLPVDGRFEWVAPGGAGTHSLPGDFQPHTIEPLNGRRVMLVVGPRGGDTSFVREIGGARMFEALPAEVRGVTKLHPDETTRWLAAIRGAVEAPQPADG